MAEEKKLSKTAQAREDAKNRRHFKEKCYEILMTKMLENSIDMRTSNKIQIQITNTNRYFSVRRYGQYLNIAIFTSGDIDVTVNEACHIEHKQRVFEFTTDLYKQERFYDEFTTMLDWLLPLGFGESDIDMHTFMDYVEGSGDVIKAYESLMEDRKKYHDDY